MKTIAHRSQELVLRPQVALHNGVYNRLLELRRRREVGQTSIEYLGIIVLVGIIAGALLLKGKDWGKDIVEAITKTVKDITSKA